MEEQQWLPVDRNFVGTRRGDPSGIHVEGTEVRARVLNLVDPGEPLRKRIQVALVGEAPIDWVVPTPLKALLAPPLQRFTAVLIGPEGHPADVEPSEPLQVGVVASVEVIDQSNAGIGQLGKDRLRW